MNRSLTVFTPILAIGAIAISGVLTGCGGADVLTRATAQRMIEVSERFKAPVTAALKVENEFKIFPNSPAETEQSVRERVLQMHLSSYPLLAVLRHLGYVKVNVSVTQPYRAKNAYGFSSASPMVLKIEPVLTETGKELAKSHGIAGDKAVPLAHREVVEVTGMKEKEGQAVVDFTWKAVPNQAGRAFDPSTDTFKGLPPELQQALTKSRGIGPFGTTAEQSWGQVRKTTASFQKYDDGWRLVSISGLQ